MTFRLAHGERSLRNLDDYDSLMYMWASNTREGVIEIISFGPDEPRHFTPWIDVIMELMG